MTAPALDILAADAVPDDGVTALKLANDADLAALVAQGALQGVARVELEFPKFTDGRAFSQAVTLRRRYGFQGDIRATGDVLIDQLLQMQRCGFTSAVLAPGVSAEAARQQLEHFGDFYQGDARQAQPRFAREVTS